MFLLTHKLLQLVITNSSLLKSRLKSFRVDKENRTIHLRKGALNDNPKAAGSHVNLVTFRLIQTYRKGQETRAHYIPLVGWCCSTTFTGNNLNKKTKVLWLMRTYFLFHFNENGEGRETRSQSNAEWMRVKQLIPRAKEQVTGFRWMQLVVAKRATPLRWR